MRTDKTLLARWPRHLIERLASQGVLVVVGAGVSKNSVNAAGEKPVGWSDLIQALAKVTSSQPIIRSVRLAVEKEDYLGAAEIVRAKMREVGKAVDWNQRIAELTDGGKADAQFQPSDVHETILRLNPEVLVTTNYDKILERATRNGYKVHTFDSSSVGEELRAGNPVLLKIHGSVDSSSALILTRSDYTRLRREGAQALAVLQALLMTRTALFLGYSFSDPDIQLLLENVMGIYGDTASHYLLTSDGIPKHLREVYEGSYGTNVITFRDGDFDEMKRMLVLLADAVDIERGI